MSTNDNKQVQLGAIFSYALIVGNALFGLFVSPFLLIMLGDGNFGVYRTIGAFSATLLVLDLGIGTTVMRYTAKYRAENKKDDIGNFAALGLIEAVVVSTVLILISIGCYLLIDNIYGETFSWSELSLAKSVFVISVVTMVGVIIDNVLFGVIMGSNRFVFANGVKLLTLLMRIGLTYAIIYVYPSAVVLTFISLFITIFNVILNYFYITHVLNIRIRLHTWDVRLFKESLCYTSLMFVQTLAVQMNCNLANIVIGAIVGAVAVAVFSFGLQMYSMYVSLATSFSNLMLPSVSKKIVDGASDAELQRLVTRVGRVQFMVLGAAFVGFACLGRDFINLWLGHGYEDVYFLALIMMAPVTLVLIQNVCLSILRARNMMKFRTVALIVAAVFNVIFTTIGVSFFGYYAAAVGTSLSILLGSVIAMNVYYHRYIGFKVFKFYVDVFRGLLLCVLIPGIGAYLLDSIYYGTWCIFAIKVIAYCVIYALLLYLYGLNTQEKELVFRRIAKR